MEVFVETELLENRKHAVVMAPDVAFEVRSSSTGWTRRNLSGPLAARHPGAAIRAKSFDLSQNKQTLAYDLALVVTAQGNDYLYLSLGNKHTEEEWENGVVWEAVPFDSTAHAAPSPLVIAGVYLMNLPPKTGTTPVQNCFVDILRRADDPLKLLDRYYIDLKYTPRWNRHTLPIDLGAGSVQSALGRRPADSSPGIYTFGNVGASSQLIYQPQYTTRTSLVPPRPTRLMMPSDPTAIASALSSTGSTNLFLAASGGLYLFTPEKQTDAAEPVLAVPASFGGRNVLGRVLSLHASTVGKTTAVWALNTQGQLIYMTCAAGKEATPSEWSAPLPIGSQVESFAFYINRAVGESNVVFCNGAAGTLQQLTQDPTTLSWQSSSILLPPTEVEDVSTFDSFTTQITVQKNGVPASNLAVLLISDTAVSFQANDLYTVLEPNKPVPINTDASGILTVIQEATSLASATCFRVRIPESQMPDILVDPLAPVMKKLAQIQSGGDFEKFPGFVAGDLRADLPISAASTAVNLSPVTSPSSLSVTLNGGSITNASKGPSASTQPSPKPVKKLKSGGFMQALAQGFEAISMQFVKMLEGGWKILIEIKDAIVEIAVALRDEISSLFDRALDWIKATWKKIKEKLLDIFWPWPDIKRTKNVYKAVFTCTTNSVIDGITNIEPLKRGPTAKRGKTAGEIERERAKNEVEKNPKANFFSYHLMNGVQQVTGETDKNAITNVVANQIGELFNNLYELIDEQTEIFAGSVSDIKHIIDNFGNMEVLDILIALVAIVGDVVVKTAGNVVDKLIKLMKLVIQGFLNIMNAEIKLPIISTVYKEFVGSKLTLLDLVCLIAAVPTTMMCKVLTGGKAPLTTTSAQTQSSHCDGQRQRSRPGDSFMSFAVVRDPNAAFATAEQQQPEPESQPTTASAPSSLADRANQKLGDRNGRTDFALAMVAYISSQIYSRLKFMQLAKEKGKAHRSSKSTPSPGGFSATIDKLCTLFYIGVLVPNATSFDPSWELNSWSYANGTIAVICFLKAVADCFDWDTLANVNGGYVLRKSEWDTHKPGEAMYPAQYWKGYISPVLDTAISLAWSVTTTAQFIKTEDKKPDVWLGYTYNMCGNIGGLMSCLLVEKVPEQAQLVGAVGVQVGMHYYGMFALAQALAMLYQE
ncbi:unnamed protein product [Parascedosporium putredinis]|uniref:Uncharacterized protein n=1 Tax=Parascedosporium putredinis TaxID=1442378 RepID=A0A9P1H644_9PEZI|nr:unnamed protein product [Parascedosporium putredinis]CAI7997027.1 unnamed protein product [Parascedosporium putredinis]